MAKFKIKIPAKINGKETGRRAMGDDLDNMSIILTGRIFIFSNGSARSYTVIDEHYPIPPELAEIGDMICANDIFFRYELKSPTTFNFYSAKWLIAPGNNNGKILTEKEKAIENAKKYVKKAMKEGDIVIKDGEFLRGSEEELEKYNMELIKE